MPDIEPSEENDYQAGSTIAFNRARWNAVMLSIATRLKARELLEASFEAMIADGTQAVLDMISENVAPQLNDLIEQINALEAQLEDIIGGGTAPNALQLGGQNPSYYLALANATGTLPVAQVTGVDVLIAAAVAGLVNAAPSTLDTLKELSDALGGDANFATSVAAALGGKQPLDATLTALAALATAADKLIYATGADSFATADLTAFARSLLDDANASTALSTLGVSAFIKTLLDDADAAAARTTLGISAANTPSAATGSVAATTVQGAIAELASEKANLATLFGAGGGIEGDLTMADEVRLSVNFIATGSSFFAVCHNIYENGVGADCIVKASLRLVDLTAGGSIVTTSTVSLYIAANEAFRAEATVAAAFGGLTSGNTYQVQYLQRKDTAVGPIYPREMRISGFNI
ncbi:hypothetical protein [Bosea sp. (in: a-proteobacteria)]|uniref:hypothetical protein n=1 Tax=Bosea sp. (in: a-proteobacteria) TaxID=1871050 RepID=UPI001ACEA51D|nr:hypothetical protein [Bosea sp. (in: a-proteobacteria)]MBN9443689.1 hypothetical protein [Bosea sp. (in: a-proteobacteria)]